MNMNIIQTWKTHEIPLQYSKFFEKIRIHGKNWNFLFFTDEDIIQFVKTKFPEYLDTFKNLKHKKHFLFYIFFVFKVSLFHHTIAFFIGLYCNYLYMDSVLDFPTLKSNDYFEGGYAIEPPNAFY